jgi:hypothetical protein
MCVMHEQSTVHHKAVYEKCHMSNDLQIFKRTGSPDGLGFYWHLDLGLKKGRGWFLNFLGAPSIIHGNTRIFLAINAIVSWLIKLAAYFLSVPANHRPSMLSNYKGGWIVFLLVSY